MTPRERDRRVGMVPCARIGGALRVETTRGPRKKFAEPQASASESGDGMASTALLFAEGRRQQMLFFGEPLGFGAGNFEIGGGLVGGAGGGEQNAIVERGVGLL